MASLLLKAGLQGKGRLLRQGDHRQWTALHVAAAGGHTTAVQLLLDAGCDRSLRNGDGLTAFEIAEQLRCQDVMDVLQPPPPPQPQHEPS